jgi:hypothetical protein
MELPPQRRIEHIIEVKAGSSPIKVRPYRYPHHHKTKIEILVQDLLKCGVITKSRSPYATPVVLVRKKDGVTPCFPQLVNITGMAKNYGELINVKM